MCDHLVIVVVQAYGKVLAFRYTRCACEVHTVSHSVT